MPQVHDIRVLRARINWAEGDQRIAERVVNRWYKTHEAFAQAIRMVTAAAPARDEDLGSLKVSVTVEVVDDILRKPYPLTLWRWAMYLNEGPEDHNLGPEDWDQGPK